MVWGWGKVGEVMVCEGEGGEGEWNRMGEVKEGVYEYERRWGEECRVEE